MDPPLEAVKIMSGFSEEVATAVIQLEWPASEPLKDSASDMVYRCIGERVNSSSDNDSLDEYIPPISFANLGHFYISITPKSGVKGKCKALWGICRLKLDPRRVGAPELSYFIDNPAALTCTSVHPCPPSMTVSTLSTCPLGHLDTWTLCPPCPLCGPS